jgi:hypothetical protein
MLSEITSRWVKALVGFVFHTLFRELSCDDIRSKSHSFSSSLHLALVSPYLLEQQWSNSVLIMPGHPLCTTMLLMVVVNCRGRLLSFTAGRLFSFVLECSAQVKIPSFPNELAQILQTAIPHT